MRALSIHQGPVSAAGQSQTLTETNLSCSVNREIEHGDMLVSGLVQNHHVIVIITWIQKQYCQSLRVDIAYGKGWQLSGIISLSILKWLLQLLSGEIVSPLQIAGNYSSAVIGMITVSAAVKLQVT